MCDSISFIYKFIFYINLICKMHIFYADVKSEILQAIPDLDIKSDILQAIPDLDVKSNILHAIPWPFFLSWVKFR